MVIDRYWNVVLANRGAAAMLDGLPDHVAGPTPNVFRVSLHPDGLAGRVINFDQWSTYLLGQLHRAALLTGNAEFEWLVEEVSGYPNLADVGEWRLRAAEADPEILVPMRLAVGDGELSLFTTLTVFGTPQDVTLAELAVELFYPADDHTQELLRRP